MPTEPRGRASQAAAQPSSTEEAYEAQRHELHHYSEGIVKALNVFSGISGAAMIVVSCLRIGAHDRMSFAQMVSTLYSILMGVLVVASSVRIEIVLVEFLFMTKLAGRGLLYIFVGTYYLNVTSSGLEAALESFADDPTNGQTALPILAGGLVLLAGICFILFHMCYCYKGCCTDGSADIEPDVADMNATALKSSARWLDYVMRLLTLLVGGFLLFSSKDIFNEHFEGCVRNPMKQYSIPYNMTTCRENLDRYSVIYLFDAIYAACFGVTVIMAGLEFVFFLKWFAFLSRPVGKGIWFFFIAVYFMGAGNDIATADGFFDGEVYAQLPFIAGFILLLISCVHVVFFIIPGMGACCSDRTKHYKRTKKEVAAGVKRRGVQTQFERGGGVASQGVKKVRNPSAQRDVEKAVD